MTTRSLAEFHTPASFRSWLKKNHAGTPELIVRLYRTHAAKKGMTYAQALDESLCFGWIDGVRRSLDADSFTIRFTPRRPRSIWSRINVGHVQRLIREGRMAKPGLIAFQKRDRRRTGIYSFERRPMEFSVRLGRKFRSQKNAWTFFQLQPPGYRRICTYWVMSARREDTRRNRLDVLIDCSKRGRPIPALARGRTAPP